MPPLSKMEYTPYYVNTYSFLNYIYMEQIHLILHILLQSLDKRGVLSNPFYNLDT